MKVEANSPTILPAVPHRELSARKLQADNIKHKAVHKPQLKPEIDRNRPHEKSVELGPDQTQLKFETDKDTGSHLIKIVDAESGAVVRQIPAEELLNITKSLQNFKGLFVSKES